VSGHGLVKRVVDYLPNEVVKSGRPRGANVHARALAYRIEALQDLDLFCAVFLG
jgi:hypothetical protein